MQLKKPSCANVEISETQQAARARAHCRKCVLQGKTLIHQIMGYRMRKRGGEGRGGGHQIEYHLTMNGTRVLQNKDESLILEAPKHFSATLLLSLILVY